MAGLHENNRRKRTLADLRKRERQQVIRARRKLVWNHYKSGMKPVKIAEKLNISYSTVANDLQAVKSYFDNKGDKNG